MLTIETRPKQKTGILTQQTLDTRVLLNPDSGQYYSLDEIGSKTWELCDGDHSISEMVTVLYAEYESSPETIQTDVLELLTELSNEGLFEEFS